MSEGKAKLFAKIATVAGAMTRLRKTGTMQGQGNYKYVTDTDIVEAVREEMAKVNLACIPSMISHQQTKDGKMVHTIGEFVFTLACGDTGETFECRWANEATDYSDKGFNKVAAAAYKYFLMKTFMITTGEPDIHESENIEQGATKKRQPPPNVDQNTGEIIERPATPKSTPTNPPPVGNVPELNLNQVIATLGNLTKASSQERAATVRKMADEGLLAGLTVGQAAAKAAERIATH